MKKSYLAGILVSILLFCFTNTVSAENRTITYRNAKIIGMGNTRVAHGYGYNGFVDNPALLSRVDYTSFSIINLPISINSDALDVGDFINDNQEKFENFNELGIMEKDEFLDDIQEIDGTWSRFNISPMVDIAVNILGNGIGLAVYSNNDIGIKPDSGIYEPRVWGEGISNTAVVLGYARPVFMLYPGLTVGINLKYLHRRKASIFQIKASDLGNINETSDPITDEFQEDTRNTVACDIGALLDIPFIDTEVGATIQSLGDGRGSSLNIGMAKRLLSDRLLLVADYIDFYDNNKENVFNKIHLGAQYQYTVFALRGGINSGYPTFGFGLNFRIIDIDAAYFWDELGNAPGIQEDKRFIAQLKLGW